MTYDIVKKELNKLANPKRARILAGFFKTGKGEYGEGDVFIGLTMLEIRIVAKKFVNLPQKDVERILHSKIHEHRMTALIIWTYQFKKAEDKIKEKIYKAYLRNTKWINSWDLVDVTAPNIVGAWLLDRDRKVLYNMAKSGKNSMPTDSLWKKRIAIVSTFAFIRENDFDDTFKISKILLNDKHDLIHKAVGWMLREVGKREQNDEERFLKKYYLKMPRTMLRYAIERFDKKKRAFYMQK